MLLAFILAAASEPCVDQGPWPCLEPGCPSPTVSCTHLSSACGALFSSVWKALPDERLEGKTVGELCLATCGRCSTVSSAASTTSSVDDVGRPAQADSACAELSVMRPRELCEAPAHACVAAFAERRASCDEECEQSGLTCESAYDDTDDSGCPASKPLPCDRPLHSKVCRCARRSCDADVDADGRVGGQHCPSGHSCVHGRCRRAADGKPCSSALECTDPTWPLCEAGGCRAPPALLVDVGRRSAIEGAHTSEGARGREGAHSGSPTAEAMCTLVGREVLTAADPADGTLQVLRLRFAPPAGAPAVGPVAHVKVRAPDAQGQRMRVRAYSMLPSGGGEGGTSSDASSALGAFELTVKVYPGGPPHSRGTSAYLASVPVGGLVHVPQVRSMGWRTPPASARRVGMVAFGVGIVECLEPLEHVLAAGGEVRLVYASRHEGAILYRRQLRRLLAEHEGRLTVRHALSRAPPVEPRVGAAGAAAEEEAQSCVAGERVTRARLDAAAVRDEFGLGGGWGDEALFIVVGTGAMEREAWSWLRDGLWPREVQPLLTGGRWRPLV